MKKGLIALLLLLVLSGHDMYLKLDTYFFEPNTDAKILLFNGTFDKSDNVITRDRMIDVSLVGNGLRTAVDSAQWTEKNETTLLSFKTGEAGTWVAGVSTAARNIEMSAEDFNGYLEHDGVLDMLEWRKQNNALDQDAVEKYSKHVKTIFQVGDKLSNDWQTVLGYPIEFVPLNNPYDLHTGHEMEVQLLRDGKPLANQLVYVGSDAKDHDSDHGHENEHEHEHESESKAEQVHSHVDGEEHSHSHESTKEHTHEDGLTHSHGSEAEHSHDAEAHEHEHEHEHEGEEKSEEGHHHNLDYLRTDAEGKVSVEITHKGIWYLRTIHLVSSEEEGLTHESNWATLTFEVGDGHSHGHSHSDEGEHEHSEEGAFGIPSYAYWIGSLALVFGLFLWFNRKKA